MPNMPSGLANSDRGASKPQNTQAGQEFLGRVVVTHVQGSPKGGGALCCVQGFEHPASRRTASQHDGGYVMFNQFRFSARMETPETSPGISSTHISFDHFDLHLVNNMSSFKGEKERQTNTRVQSTALAVDRHANITLAPREKEVLTWAALGKSAWETAVLLDLAESTVKSYIKNACSRLGAQNKTHAVAICIEHNLLRD